MCSCIDISPMVQQQPRQSQYVVLTLAISMYQHQWSLADLRA